jgi:hypothetical protein
MLIRRHFPYDLVSNLPGGVFISFCKGLVAEWNMALEEPDAVLNFFELCFSSKLYERLGWFIIGGGAAVPLELSAICEVNDYGGH